MLLKLYSYSSKLSLTLDDCLDLLLDRLDLRFVEARLFRGVISSRSLSETLRLERESDAHGLAASVAKLRGRMEAGVSISNALGWAIRAEVFYDGIGAGRSERYGGDVQLSLPLR